MISSEVGSHITIGESDVRKYYDAHKSRICASGAGSAARNCGQHGREEAESELPDLKKKAETALKRVQDGEDFGEIAKRLSDGSTKAQGGFIGAFTNAENCEGA